MLTPQQTLGMLRELRGLERLHASITRNHATLGPEWQYRSRWLTG